MLLLKIVLFSTFIGIISSARILAIVPTPAYSHQIAFRPIWKTLLARGHHITLLTTDPLDDAAIHNLTEINLNFVYGLVNKTKIIKKYKKNFIDVAEELLDTRTRVFDAEMGHPDVAKLIKSANESFDLLIAEYNFPAFFMFQHKFKCPFIGIVSMEALALAHSIVGNPIHPIAYPDTLSSFASSTLTLKERIFSVLFYIYMQYFLYYRVFPVQEEIVKKHFGIDTPSLMSVAENVDMLFLDFNPILYYVRPTTPAVLYMGGGIHLDPEQRLSQELQMYLDDAPVGVIYFSLGSNIKSTDLSQENLQIILDTFASLPYKVLWKFEGHIRQKSSNVKTLKWLPQQAILRHPNVLLFITQGGIQSVDEAVFYKVPMLGIPFYGDQMFNVIKLASKGVALYLNHQELSRDNFKGAILELIQNYTYKENVERISKLSLDQPMTNLEKVVWWTEYVIRNKGAKHLKGSSHNVPLYQYWLFDVLTILALVLFSFMYILHKLITTVFIKISQKIKKD